MRSCGTRVWLSDASFWDSPIEDIVMTTTKNLPLLTAIALLAIGLNAQAQQIFRIVGPDGKVTFSDKPPPDDTKAKVTAASVGAESGSGGASLPFELRQPTSKYPVTLYSSADCGPCDTGRVLLKSRGIPYSEKSISSNEDVEALKRIAGDASLPFLTIGGQKIKGLSESEWTQYLDAAGYPKKSILPPTYKFATASPLVAVQKPVAAAPKVEAKPEVPPPAPAAPARNPENPAGITF
jgi:glutaredoxin